MKKLINYRLFYEHLPLKGLRARRVRTLSRIKHRSYQSSQPYSILENR